MIYIASPYSDKDPIIRQHRYVDACKACAFLMKIYPHRTVYSPIVHAHPIAVVGNLPKGWGFWSQQCTYFLKFATTLLVLKLKGWEDSVGVAEEVELAEKLGIDIMYETLKDLELRQS
jgi:hypothetical protein